MSGLQQRVEFVRYVGLVLTIASRAISQALDPTKRDLRVADVRRYIKATRKMLDALEKAIIP